MSKFDIIKLQPKRYFNSSIFKMNSSTAAAAVESLPSSGDETESSGNSVLNQRRPRWRTQKKEEPFKLTDTFISKYANKKPPFGFNGLGEVVYMRTYSRSKENGQKESW